MQTMQLYEEIGAKEGISTAYMERCKVYLNQRMLKNRAVELNEPYISEKVKRNF